MKKIRVLVVRPNAPMHIEEVEDNLKSYQKIVGGYLEHFTIPGVSADLWLNEEGKLLGLEPNFFIKEYGEPIVGTVFFSGSTPDGDMASITNEQIEEIKKYFFE